MLNCGLLKSMPSSYRPTLPRCLRSVFNEEIFLVIMYDQNFLTDETDEVAAYHTEIFTKYVMCA